VDHLLVKLFDGRIAELDGQGHPRNDRWRALQVSFGDDTALVNLWRVVKE